LIQLWVGIDTLHVRSDTPRTHRAPHWAHLAARAHPPTTLSPHFLSPSVELPCAAVATSDARPFSSSVKRRAAATGSVYRWWRSRRPHDDGAPHTRGSAVRARGTSGAGSTGDLGAPLETVDPRGAGDLTRRRGSSDVEGRCSLETVSARSSPTPWPSSGVEGRCSSDVEGRSSAGQRGDGRKGGAGPRRRGRAVRLAAGCRGERKGTVGAGCS
jgi:hypothetical protein